MIFPKNVEPVESRRIFGDRYDHMESQNEVEENDSRDYRNRLPSQTFRQIPNIRPMISNSRPVNSAEDNENYVYTRNNRRKFVPVNQWRISFNGNVRGWDLLETAIPTLEINAGIVNETATHFECVLYLRPDSFVFAVEIRMLRR